ncbi:MAG: hypothetical protein AAFU61_00190 [Pseudomonadota bacterium]
MSTDAPSSIPPELEKKIFVRFWNWLSIAATVLVLITGAAWSIISVSFVNQASRIAQDEARSAVEEFQDEVHKAQEELENVREDHEQILENIFEIRAESSVTLRAILEQLKEAQAAAGDAVVLANEAEQTFSQARTDVGAMLAETQERAATANTRIGTADAALAAGQANVEALVAETRALADQAAARGSEVEATLARVQRVAEAAEQASISVDDIDRIIRTLSEDEGFRRNVSGSALDSLEGVVVASTVRCAALGGGWEDYVDGAGKFLLGAGSGTLVNSGPHSQGAPGSTTALTGVRAGAQGGAEQHLLRPAEMPTHSHTVNDPGHNHTTTWVTENRSSGRIGFSGIRGPLGGELTGASTTGITLGTAGGDRPHNNMPPYIAVHFCRKT